MLWKDVSIGMFDFTILFAIAIPGEVVAGFACMLQLLEDVTKRLTDDKLIEPRGLAVSEMSTADVDILDLSLYASDMCHSLHCFLQVHTPACLPFHKSHIYKM